MSVRTGRAKGRHLLCCTAKRLFPPSGTCALLPPAFPPGRLARCGALRHARLCCRRLCRRLLQPRRACPRVLLRPPLWSLVHRLCLHVLLLLLLLHLLEGRRAQALPAAAMQGRGVGELAGGEEVEGVLQLGQAGELQAACGRRRSRRGRGLFIRHRPGVQELGRSAAELVCWARVWWSGHGPVACMQAGARCSQRPWGSSPLPSQKKDKSQDSRWGPRLPRPRGESR